MGFLRAKKQCNWWCAACGGQYDWRNPNSILVIQHSADRRDATVFRSHAAAHGVCDNLVNAFKLLATQQQNGDSLVKVLVVEGLQERNRLKMMEELRNDEAVKIGDLEKTQELLRVVKPMFTGDFPGAVVREGVDELTLRREETGMLRTCIDTTDVGGRSWGPPLVGMPFVRLPTEESRDRNGRTCTTSTLRRTKRSISKTQGSTRRQGRCGQRSRGIGHVLQVR